MTANKKNTKRKSQEQRSREMRKRLIEATLDCLEEFGYHGTSLPRILDRAGVSRGGWNHHFKTKKELIASAAREGLFEGAIKKAMEDSSELQGDEISQTLLDYIWDNFYQGKARNIWVELTVASRTDKELNKLMAPIFMEFVDSLDTIWRTKFKTTVRTKAPVELLLNLTLYVIGGMGLQSIIHDNPKYYQSLREQWMEMLTPLLSTVKAE